MLTQAVYQCQCPDCQGIEKPNTSAVHHQMNLFMSRLDEQQRRWYAAIEAKRLGHGGNKQVSQITGLHVNTISRGRKELAQQLDQRPMGRIRLKGGGRKPVEKKNPEVIEQLEKLVSEDTAGDPCRLQKWVRRSLRWLSKTLSKTRINISHMSIRRLLKQNKYSLKANRKCVTTTTHKDRNRQFHYIRRVKELFEKSGHGIISVDAKKKELIGNFKNPGESWCQEPEEVNDHDFPQDAQIKAIPYGLYEVNRNRGYVYVGTSGNTSVFAVDAISHWYKRQDRSTFADESKLLILSDAGGSNGYRVRNWKKQLQEKIADRFNIEVMVCHYPPGTSKWNPIEHRLFSFISINWAAQPLRSLNHMLALIRGTTTEKGLKVKASILRGNYPTKIKVSDQQMAQLNISRRKVSPQWNYILKPRIPPL